MFHAIELTKEELQTSKKVSKTVNMLREHLVNKSMCDRESSKKWVDGDWPKGIVFVRKEGKGKLFRVFEKNKTDQDLALGSDAGGVDIGFDFGAHLPIINE